MTILQVRLALAANEVAMKKVSTTEELLRLSRQREELKNVLIELLLARMEAECRRISKVA